MGGTVTIQDLKDFQWSAQREQTSPQNYAGNYCVPQPIQQPCPNCGHCPCCGRGGYHAQPLWPGYPSPYIGDWPYGGVTWGGTSGSLTTNGNLGQGWN
jgi:hypothetical protein